MPTTPRGHGAYGLRSGLRPYSDLDSLSAVRRHTYCERYAAQLVDGTWSADGDAWTIAYAPTFDGRYQDPVAVVIATATLVRVETSAACDATAGTWFWDNDDPTDLWVHLPNDADPNGVDVVALTIFGDWTGTADNPALFIQPILGANLLTDGGVEDWSGANTLTSWTTSVSAKGVGSLEQDDPLLDDGGEFSARLDTDGVPAGTCGISQALTLQAGKAYRFSGAYKTQAGSTITARLVIPSAGANPVQEDGRVLGSVGPDLDATDGEEERFSFDAVWPTGGTTVEFQSVNPGSVTGSVWFDGLAVQRIYGWRFFEPALSQEGLPELVSGAADVYPGTETGGGGTVTILNRNVQAMGRTFEGVTGITGYMEGQLSRWWFVNQLMVMRYGGQFLDDGQDIVWEDMRRGFAGFIRGSGCDDQTGQFEVEEFRTLLETELPLQRYTATAFANAPASARERHRPYWFGYEENVSPQQIDTVSTSGLPIYELVDPAIAPNSSTVMYTTAGALDNVWVYENLDAAAAKDPDLRKELTLTTDYTISASTAQITLVRNPYIVRIVSGVNDRLDFTANSVTYAAEIAPGLYTIHELKAELQTVMNALAGAVYTWSFTESSGGVPVQKYSVAYSGGGSNVFKLADGTNKDRSIFETIGYTGDDNLTGASLTADTAMPYDGESFPLRVDNYGYRDDAAGTYTGSANAAIVLAPDIFKVLLVKVLNVDPAQISSSFETARTTCPQDQSVYIGGLTSVQGGASFPLTMEEIRQRFAIGCNAYIVFDGQVGAHFLARTDTVPADAASFYEWDFLSWSVGLPADDTYGTARVNYYQDPTLGVVQGVETTNTRTVLLHRRPHPRTFDTFLTEEADAEDALGFISAQARSPMRRITFSVVGRGTAHKVGDFVRLTRAQTVQGFEETGGLAADPFRILRVSKNPIDGTNTYTVVTNVLV